MYIPPRRGSSVREAIFCSQPRIRNFSSFAAASVNVKATIWSLGTPSTAIHQATLRAMTSVFPEPAPATTSRRRARDRTASDCSSFRPFSRTSEAFAAAIGI